MRCAVRRIVVRWWGRSSAGRARRSQCRGRGFDPLRLHQFLSFASHRIIVVLTVIRFLCRRARWRHAVPSRNWLPDKWPFLNAHAHRVCPAPATQTGKVPYRRVSGRGNRERPKERPLGNRQCSGTRHVVFGDDEQGDKTTCIPGGNGPDDGLTGTLRAPSVSGAARSSIPTMSAASRPAWSCCDARANAAALAR